MRIVHCFCTLAKQAMGTGTAAALILSCCVINKWKEKHEGFVEYYHRSGRALRFNVESRNITEISFCVDYGFDVEKKGSERFENLHDGKITEKPKQAICSFDDVLGIGREIIKRYDKPDGSCIYINCKGGLQWKSATKYGKTGKSTFNELQIVIKKVDQRWLNKIHVHRDKVVKGSLIKKSSINK